MLDVTRQLRLTEPLTTTQGISDHAARIVESLVHNLEPPSPAVSPYRAPARPPTEWSVGPSAERGAEGATGLLVRDGSRYSITLARPGGTAAERRDAPWQLHVSVSSMAPLSRARRAIKDVQITLVLLLSLAAGAWATVASEAIAFGALASLAAMVVLILVVLLLDGTSGQRPRPRDSERRFYQSVLGAVGRQGSLVLEGEVGEVD